VLKARQDIASELSMTLQPTPQISGEMHRKTSIPTSESRDIIFISSKDQRDLVLAESPDTNAQARTKWFNARIVATLLYIISAILHAVFPNVPVRYQFFCWLANSFLSWLQVKKPKTEPSMPCTHAGVGSVESLAPCYIG
jgi:hypothetical protein